MKVKDFRREIQKCGEGENQRNQQMEQSGVKSIKNTVLKHLSYLTISEQPIEVQTGKIHDI